MYYLCSEIKGADQMGSYCAADLRLWQSFAYANFWFSDAAAHSDTKYFGVSVCVKVCIYIWYGSLHASDSY